MNDNNDKIQKGEEKDPDFLLWQAATKDVKPIKNRNVNAKLKTLQNNQVNSKPPKTREPVMKPDIHIARQIKPESGMYETDANTARRLKRGQIPIEARLDMHGMNQTQAYSALQSFILSCVQRNFRCVLLITGKGGKKTSEHFLYDDHTGILKKRTPVWLNEPLLKEHILKIEQAKPKDGGAGAFYVLLRKKR